MTCRITDAQVKELLIGVTTDTTPFIETANLIVDEELLSKGHSVDRLKKIELYLAAHFAAAPAGGSNLTKIKAGDSMNEYSENNLGKQFNSTVWGQTAIALDTTGTLRSLGGGSGQARFTVV